MEDQWQRALADVVRSELALSDRTAKDAYTSLGISSTAWQTYFKRQTRDIPSRVLLDLAAYLGMPLSVLLAKAEARAAQLELERPAATLSEHITRQVSPEAQAAIAEGTRQVKGESRKRQSGH